MSSQPETTRSIDLPAAEDLDTAGRQQVRVSLYLIPAAETEGAPRVTTHESIGSTSWPMAAHNDRWALIGGYDQGTVGASVLEALEAITDDLLAASDAYRGTEWDGSNHVGSWEEDAREILAEAWEGQVADEPLAAYWTPADWYQGMGGDDALRGGLRITPVTTDEQLAKIAGDEVHVAAPEAHLDEGDVLEYLTRLRDEARAQYEPSDLVACISGDGWSLHAPGSTDEQIAEGVAPPLLTGPWTDDEREVPAEAYSEAFARWQGR